METDFAADVPELHVAGTALQIEVAVQSFHPLVSRAAVAPHSGVGRGRDLVVDGDITEAHIVDVDTVPGLSDGRVLFDLADVPLPVSREPVVAHMNLSPDHHRSRGATVDR